MVKEEIISLIDEKIVSNESGNITAEVLNNVLKEIVKMKEQLTAVIDVNPVVVGQYATIMSQRTNTYVYIQTINNEFLRTTIGKGVYGTSVMLSWNKAIKNQYGPTDFNETPSIGICVAPKYQYEITVKGFATSDIEYSSWEEIPNEEKVEFTV